MFRPDKDAALQDHKVKMARKKAYRATIKRNSHEDAGPQPTNAMQGKKEMARRAKRRDNGRAK